MNQNQLKALRLINQSVKGTTEYARVLVSDQVPALLRENLIDYNENNMWGYSLTAKGKEVVKNA